MRRALKILFRFVLDLQGAVVLGGRILRDEAAVEIEVRRRTNAKPRCPECRGVLHGVVTMHLKRWRQLDLFQPLDQVPEDHAQVRMPLQDVCDFRVKLLLGYVIRAVVPAVLDGPLRH